ncbi:MAG: hypothetical protein SOY67_04440 [Collinsella sp.]|nr:hypothetical protein [Collinsella sp.]
MTVECVDGRSGRPHIDGEDKGRLHAGVVGTRSVVLKTGKQLAATQDSANKVTVATGDCIVHGRHCSVTAAEQVTITSGTQGQKRNDLICMHYMRRGSGDSAIDSAELAVLRGTPTTGTPADPAVPGGNVLEGAVDDWMPLYRVSLDGVTAAKPVPVFELAPSIVDLWDSISQSPRVIVGSKSFQTGGGTAHRLMTQSEFASICGRAFDPDRDCISVMNGSWRSTGVAVTCAVYNEDDACSIYVFTASALRDKQWIRVNYTVTLGA